jgi:sialate O-acetylesterase
MVRQFLHVATILSDSLLITWTAMSKYSFFLRSAALTSVAIFSGLMPAQAKVTLPGFFSDHMVIQRDAPIKVWGTARPGEKIQVSFGREKLDCVASKNGNWHVICEEVSAGPPREMKIQGDNTIVFKDVMLGDVFMFVGQTELLPPIKNVPGAPTPVANPNVRLFMVPPRLVGTPAGTMSGSWKSVDPGSTNLSAIAYQFATEIQPKVKVPVGIIECKCGATLLSSWISRDRLSRSDPAALGQALSTSLKFSTEAVKAQQESGGSAGTASGITSFQPSAAYNGMVAPLVGVGLKAICSYQGLTDLSMPTTYRRLFPAMIKDWRSRWAQEPDVPFIFIQLPSKALAPFTVSETALNKLPANFFNEIADDSYFEIRDAQATTQSLNSTLMVNSIDYPDVASSMKKDALPHRLVNAVLSRVYHEPVVAVGPVFESYTSAAGKIKLTFKHAEKGIVYRPGKDNLSGFDVFDTKGRIFPAEAQVVDSQLVVSSAQVINPIELRYDCKDATAATVFNSEGLPAAPFKISIRP